MKTKLKFHNCQSLDQRQRDALTSLALLLHLYNNNSSSIKIVEMTKDSFRDPDPSGITTRIEITVVNSGTNNRKPTGSKWQSLLLALLPLAMVSMHAHVLVKSMVIHIVFSLFIGYLSSCFAQQCSLGWKCLDGQSPQETTRRGGKGTNGTRGNGKTIRRRETNSTKKSTGCSQGMLYETAFICFTRVLSTQYLTTTPFHS